MEVKDSVGNILTKEQIEYFKDSKIRDKSGNLLVCYHGTTTPGFKEFNPSAIEGQFGKYKFNTNNVNFFTTSKQIALGYTEQGYERDGNVYACYLNIVNPYMLDNQTTDEIKSWKGIKNTDIRKGLIDAFKKFWNKWNSRQYSIDAEDLEELNKDLFYFNYKIISSMDRTDSWAQGYGKDPDWYDVVRMEENTKFGVERSVMPSYSLEELFDDDMYEEWRDNLVGNYEEDEDDYWLTTNDVIRYVLLLNKNGANYDGIIVPDIFDVGSQGSIFDGRSTDIITLGSSSQIKEITNKTPTSSNKIDEDKLYFVNKKVTEKLVRTDKFDMFETQSPYEAKNYILSKKDEAQRIYIDENIPLYLIGSTYECTHTDMVNLAKERGWNVKWNDFDPKKTCVIYAPKNKEYNTYVDYTDLDAIEDDYTHGYFFDDFSLFSRYNGISKTDFYKAIKQSAKPLTTGKLTEKVSPAGYEPKKTGKAYKVFKVKNGKLYPPMVANTGGADTPVGVWLDAEEGEFAGLSKTGRPQVKSTGSGTLSYRPGWHLGDVPRAKQFDRLNKETGEYEFPKDFVWAECDYAMDVDYQPESDARGYERTKIDDNGNVITYRSDKYQHSLAGLPKIPSNGYYKYRTNPNPDTVPWVITGQMKVNRLLSDDEVNAILRQNGIEPIHRQGGDKTLAELGLKESIRESFSHVDGDYTYEEVDKWLKDNYKWSSSPNKATGAQLIDKEGKFIQTKKEEYHGDILNKMVKAEVIKLGPKYIDQYNLVNTDLLSGLGYVRCNNEDYYQYLQLPNKLTSAQMSSLENWLYKYFTNKKELIDIECPVRKQYVRYFLDDDFHSWSTTNSIYGGTLDELIDMINNFNRGASLRESLLTEKTRQELINKSRSGDNYSIKNQKKGKNRWERRKYSQIANSIRDYNNIDMNTFWKEDLLEFKIKIHGETDDYLITIIFENILKELQKEVKANNNKLEFKCVLRALLKSFNSDNVYVNCTCPDFTYRFKYWSFKNKYSSAIPDRWSNVAPLPHNMGGAAGANDKDTKGAACKHVNLVLANTDWMMKVASVINNYAKWCKQNMTRNYADYIFPQIYGMSYDKAIQLSIFDDPNDNGLLPSDQETITKIIDKNLSNRDEKGKWIKGNEYRFKPNPNKQKAMKPEENNSDQIKMKINKNKQMQLPDEEEENNG